MTESKMMPESKKIRRNRFDSDITYRNKWSAEMSIFIYPRELLDKLLSDRGLNLKGDPLYKAPYYNFIPGKFITLSSKPCDEDLCFSDIFVDLTTMAFEEMGDGTIEDVDAMQLYKTVRSKLPDLSRNDVLMIILYVLLEEGLLISADDEDEEQKKQRYIVKTLNKLYYDILSGETENPEALEGPVGPLYSEGKAVKEKWETWQSLFDDYENFFKNYIRLSRMEATQLKDIASFQEQMSKIKGPKHSPFVENYYRYRYQPKILPPAAERPKSSSVSAASKKTASPLAGPLPGKKTASPLPGPLPGKAAVAVTPMDGIDIFDSSLVSLEIPYIHYTDENNNTYHKIYNFGYTFIDFLSRVIDDEKEKERESNSRTEKRNTIVFAILNEATIPIDKLKKHYTRIVYELESNDFYLDIEVNEKMLKNIYERRLKNAFPVLSFDNPIQEQLSGTFNIYNMKVEDYTLYDEVFNEPLFRNYLYVNERIAPFPNKKYIIIQFRDLFNNLSPSGAQDENTLYKNYFRLKPQKAGEGDKKDKENKEDFIKVKMTGKNSLHISHNIDILVALLAIYELDQPRIETFYCGLIPTLCVEEAVNNDEKPTKKSRPKAEKNTLLNALREKVPELFSSGYYSTICQKKQQPIIVSKEDKKKYANTIDYPKLDEYTFACTHKEFIYPGLQDNTDPSNKDKYAYVPCCFKTNHKTAKNSKYNAWLKGISKPARVSKKKENASSHFSKSARILPTGEYGKIPDTLNQYLKNVIKTSSDFARLGVPHDANSAISCLLLATEDEDYMKAKTDAARLLVTSATRQDLILDSFKGLYRQENYDVTDTFLMHNLANNNIFFDPYLYYRGLEEYFDLNIYVFHPETTKEVDFQVPRYKIFYANPKKERQAILLYVHRGTESSAAEISYPQCELVTEYDRESKFTQKIFDETVDDNLYISYTLRIKNKSWFITDTLVKVGEEKEIKSSIRSVDDLYSEVNYNEDYQLPVKNPKDKKEVESSFAREQIVDDYGKLRALIYYANDADGVKNKGLTLMIPPSQPLNMKMRNYKQYPLTTYEEALTFMEGSPAVSYTFLNANQGEKDRIITGIWFDLVKDGVTINKECLYIPIVQTLHEKKKHGRPELGPSNPINEGGIDVSERTYRLQRTLDFITQLVKWLFIVKQLEYPLKDNIRELYPVDKFVKEFFMVDKKKADEDSSTYYDFGNLLRTLPKVKTTKEGIAYMEKLKINLFRDGKIVMYNANFADKMGKYLEEFAKNNSPLPIPLTPLGAAVGNVKKIIRNLDWRLPQVIANYYNMAEDFNQQENSYIFINDEDFYKWLDMIKLPSYISVTINNNLDGLKPSLEEPYLYIRAKEEEGKEKKENIVIIQNSRHEDRNNLTDDEVSENNIRYALHVCDKWFQNKINVGITDEMYAGLLPSILVYGIEEDQLVIVNEDLYRRGGDKYYSLLQYSGTNKYAAIMLLE